MEIPAAVVGGIAVCGVSEVIDQVVPLYARKFHGLTAADWSRVASWRSAASAVTGLVVPVVVTWSGHRTLGGIAMLVLAALTPGLFWAPPGPKFAGSYAAAGACVRKTAQLL